MINLTFYVFGLIRPKYTCNHVTVGRPACFSREGVPVPQPNPDLPRVMGENVGPDWVALGRSGWNSVCFWVDLVPYFLLGCFVLFCFPGSMMASVSLEWQVVFFIQKHEYPLVLREQVCV